MSPRRRIARVSANSAIAREGRLREAVVAGRAAGAGPPFMPPYIAEPEDIAGVVSWLASDDSRMVTAARISADLGSSQF